MANEKTFEIVQEETPLRVDPVHMKDVKAVAKETAEEVVASVPAPEGGTKLYKHVIHIVGADDTAAEDTCDIVCITNDDTAFAGSKRHYDITNFISESLESYVGRVINLVTKIYSAKSDFENSPHSFWLQGLNIRDDGSLTVKKMGELYEVNGELEVSDTVTEL